MGLRPALLCTAALACACTDGRYTEPPFGGDAGFFPVDASALDAGPPLTQLRNVDVTIVYPLPTGADHSAWISATNLLPASVFDDGVPQLDDRAPLATDAERLASLRAVAVRVDPCRRQIVPADMPCRAELRIVFQSLLPDGAARDGAFHAFYVLADDVEDAILAALRALRAERESEPPVPLGVHPRLLAEGVDGPFGQRIAALIATHASPFNLVRVTHFARIGDAPPTWDFGIRDRVGGRWSASVVPTTTVTTQRMRTISGGRWDADVTPPLTHEDDPTRLFRVGQAERAAAFNVTVRLLNPRDHSSETVDCASCHLAPDIAIFARETMSLAVGDDPSHFTSTYPLDHDEKDVGEAIGFANVHMSSYSGRVLSLSARAVNETATVLEQVNRE